MAHRTIKGEFFKMLYKKLEMTPSKSNSSQNTRESHSPDARCGKTLNNNDSTG